ncbi:MAG: hypothetical protein JSU95_14075 [Betaproteobacteria bacterium]|nr:MAG: hypothetical protein JSU95_14075 [Betaproteobacteria bacterium]
MNERENFRHIVNTLAVATVLLVGNLAFSQDEVQKVTTACQASLKELVFWCVTLPAAEQPVVPPVEQANNCATAKKRTDGYCYPLEVRQLGCASALQEMEVWCSGKAHLNVTDVVSFCEESQRNVRLFCY